MAASYDDLIDFETFIKDLTEKMVFLNKIVQGNPFSQEGRDALFKLVDVEQKGTLDSDDIARISEELRFNLTA